MQLSWEGNLFLTVHTSDLPPSDFEMQVGLPFICHHVLVLVLVLGANLNLYNKWVYENHRAYITIGLTGSRGATCHIVFQLVVIDPDLIPFSPVKLYYCLIRQAINQHVIFEYVGWDPPLA